MIQRRIAIGVFVILVVISAAMIFEPIYYGRAPGTAFTKVIDIWSGFLGIVIGYLYGTRQLRKKHEPRPLSKMQKYLAWGVFFFLVFASFVMMLYPWHYGKFASEEFAKVIDIWSVFFGSVIGYYFGNQNQG
jgi:hypothetical protein